jgi:MFS superfamily sulfate permease-like transporter
MKSNNLPTPKTGLQGFKENIVPDALSGFLVSLIALPLSLGIASAYGFPPVMGVITAIVGGVVVTFFTNSELTIKGPAAGLIIIVGGAVEELGKGNNTLGWHLTLGVVLVSALIQVIFGLTRVAELADFFPLSAVHGMLSAIGIIIIISKQIHLAIGIAPAALKGKDPVALIMAIPESLLHMNPGIAVIGILSLIILFGMPMIKSNFLRKVPPALVVLIIGVALGQFFQLNSPEYQDLKPLINPGKFTFSMANISFSGMGGDTLGIFIKYVIMFAIIGSLESLLTGKAIDLLDPFKRKTDLSKDLTAVGIGNAVSGILGGSPMISEVARSSANVNFGAKTRWSNFFHGLFLLVYVLILAPFIEMVPVASLAAMLIYVGYRLASPKEFIRTYKTGKEQLIIFLVTIIVTVASDLLSGIACGILLKFMLHLFKGVSPANFFKINMSMEDDGTYTFRVKDSAIFSNYLGLKRKIRQLPEGKTIIIDCSGCTFIDHTVMENLTELGRIYSECGGSFEIRELHHLSKVSEHPLAARVAVKRM